jgi:DNA-binding transcriptional ArsR family regulator
MDGHGAQLAALAGVLADETRAEVCLALLDGRAWTAGELAAQTGVAASTMTEHLHRLHESGLVAQHHEGRHRYVELASSSVAELLETMVGQVRVDIAPPPNLRAARRAGAMSRARTCYDHLAGRLGCTIADAMVQRGLLDHDGGFALTEDGFGWLDSALGIGPAALRAVRRPAALGCLDWTERRTHLGGAAGAQLAERLFERRWIRRAGTGRAVDVTPAGRTALHTLFSIDC